MPSSDRQPERRVTAPSGLEDRIDALFALPSSEALPPEAGDIVESLLRALEEGTVRSAVRAADGEWRALPWVKRGILLGFHGERSIIE